MKKLIVLCLLLFAGYKLHQNGYSLLSPNGAFDKKGNPLVVLVVGPGCAEPCNNVVNLLNKRGVAFEQISVAGQDGAPVSNKYAITRFPTTLVGKQEILGDDTTRITSALAEAYGKDVLTRTEQMAMNNHFDAQGKPKVVMYGTSWCPYCKQQRAFFAENKIAFDEFDVEASKPNEMAYNMLQGNGYPLTYVGYRRFSGFQEGEILTAIAELSKTKVASVR
jgi:glutaredoxin